MAASKKSEEISTVEDSSQEVVLSLTARQDAVGAVTSLSELRDVLGEAKSWEDVEPNFQVAKKDDFEGKPLVIGGFRFNQSKKYMQRQGEALIPGEFVSALVAEYDEHGNFIPQRITENGEAIFWVIVNDGGSGINKQLERYAAKYDEDVNVGARMAPPLKCSAGFRKSEYAYETEDEAIMATTWYIA